MRAAYEALLARIDRFARLTIIVTSGAMIIIVSVQVFLRYVFNTSIDWSDEVSRLLFVWCMFLAIPFGIREGSHVGVQLAITHFPQATRRNLERLTSLVAVALMAMVLYQTTLIAHETWDELLPTLNLSANWFLVPLGLCAAHSILHLLQLLWREPVRSIATME